MNPNNAIVIHPNDPSTKFLDRLYSGYGDKLILTEENNNKSIKQSIKDENDDRIIMMLGHGCPQGLLAPQKNKNYRGGVNQFGRLIINSSHVQMLRKKQCIGIWCYAVEFARKYGLHGLFSGMIISELYEAQYCGIEGFTEAEIKMMNQDFAEALYDCINKYPLNEVPEAMEHYISSPNKIELFNFSNLYYL